MAFKYRVKGKVERAFIIRGLHFDVGSQIDFYVTEKELEFVKERCQIAELIDSTKPIDNPKPMLEEPQIENEPKGEKENVELHKPNTSRKTKVKVSG